MKHIIEKSPNINDVLETHNRIKTHINITPVLSSKSINAITGAEIYFKCENFQKTGAFKFRGATNAILSLNKDQMKSGVATHSSGNHAAALSLAARNIGIKAYIVMPETAPLIKKKAVNSYDGKITTCKPTLEAREKTLEHIIKKTNAEFIHPYNNFNVICGQATSAIELMKEKSELDIIMTPVGGGGLLSGTSIAAKGLNPNVKVIGAEPKNADDAYRSIKAGYIIPSVNPQTIADGLLTSLGSLSFKIISENVDNIITVSEESIIEAMRMIWERMKIIIEPSSAVPIAAVIENRSWFKNKKVGIIISGGNVDLNNLPF